MYGETIKVDKFDYDSVLKRVSALNDLFDAFDDPGYSDEDDKKLQDSINRWMCYLSQLALQQIEKDIETMVVKEENKQK